MVEGTVDGNPAIYNEYNVAVSYYLGWGFMYVYPG